MNLFLTSITEEALYRGFLLKHIDIAFNKIKFGQYLNLVIVSVFFGLLHFNCVQLGEG